MKYKFGEKLRNVREKRKITLKDVADRVGVSESLISQIERNKVSPAVETLLNIAEALEVDLEYLFQDIKRNRKVNLVREKDRNSIYFDGVSYEQLVKTIESTSEHGIEGYIMTIDSGKESGGKEYGHIGRELGVIIEGNGRFSIGSESYELAQGDSISFDSDVPHSLKNTGSGKLKAFWIITPPKSFRGKI